MPSKTGEKSEVGRGRFTVADAFSLSDPLHNRHQQKAKPGQNASEHGRSPSGRQRSDEWMRRRQENLPEKRPRGRSKARSLQGRVCRPRLKQRTRSREAVRQPPREEQKRRVKPQCREDVGLRVRVPVCCNSNEYPLYAITASASYSGRGLERSSRGCDFTLRNSSSGYCIYSSSKHEANAILPSATPLSRLRWSLNDGLSRHSATDATL